jgi:hypothetical protein
MTDEVRPPPTDDWWAEFQAQQAENVERGCAAITATWEQLVALGATEVRIAYDGYGDSGSIHDVTARAGDMELALPGELATALSTAAEWILPAGWENEIGAMGELVLDVIPRRLRLEHQWRTETYEPMEDSWQL